MSMLQLKRTVSKFAEGKKAWGQCQKCGHRFLRSQLSEDPDTGLLVCRRDRDPVHPQETVIQADDPIALERPAPDLDDPGSDTNTDLENDERTTFPMPGDR